MSAPINSSENENENENKDNDTVIHTIESFDLENNDNDNKKSEKKDIESNEVLLKLGDIILITDPTNEILNNNTFFIEYIDPNKVKLINTVTFEKTLIPISLDGFIGDGNIETITIISSSQESGYARQNGLLPGVWITLYFGG